MERYVHKEISGIEKSILGFILVVTLFSIAMKYINNDFFVSVIATEDGIIEWLTVVGLTITAIVCFRRVILLRDQKTKLFIFMTALLGIAFIFGAGEEISWGQRIFNTQSSEFFLQHNAQGETNLHNLVVGGKKINKIVFGVGLHLVLLIYLLVLVPLYKRKQGLKDFMDRFAVPIATPYQVISYLIALTVIQIIMDDSKRGELAEFAGSFLFFLNIAFPYNRELFQLDSGQQN
jgi:hypothetical protein